MAGLVLASLLIPQGMAYAELAGLPPITGLYTSIMCLLAYAVFGPSRDPRPGARLRARPDDRGDDLPVDGGDGDRSNPAVALASVLALMVGAFMLLGAWAGLGFIADLLSKPTQIGYMNGLALTILIGQLPKLFGFSTDADGLVDEAVAFVQGVAAGETVPAALAIGSFGLALMLVLSARCRRSRGPRRGRRLDDRGLRCSICGARGCQLVGVLPSGLPPLTIPRVALADMPLLVGGASGSRSSRWPTRSRPRRRSPTRTGQEVDANQEMVGIGAANVAAGLFQGFPVSTSGSRTRRRGAGRRQDAADRRRRRRRSSPSCSSSCPACFQYLPSRRWPRSSSSPSLSLADIPGDPPAVAAAPHRVLPVDGCLPAASRSRRPARHRDRGGPVDPRSSSGGSWDPYRTRARRRPGLPGYHDIRMYPDAEQVPGLVIYRFDGPLFFANARTFRDEVRAARRADPPPRWIIVASEPITDVDTTAADMLEELDAELEAAGVDLVFAEMKDAVRGKIQRLRAGVDARQDAFYPTVNRAVKEYRAAPRAAEAGRLSGALCAGTCRRRAGAGGTVDDRVRHAMAST